MEVEQLLFQLRNLIDTMPDFSGEAARTLEGRLWLGRAAAMVEACGSPTDAAAFASAMDSVMGETILTKHWQAVNKVSSIIFRAFARIEAKAPANLHGSYIPAGNAFDALTAISKVFSAASRSLLVVDPYLDEKLFTDFLPTAPDTVSLQVLSDSATCKPSLAPAVARWKTQFSTARQLDARLAAPRILHDRLIVVDDAIVWIVTQSFNALAQRSPASVAKFDPEPGKLKLDAYRDIWAQATRI